LALFVSPHLDDVALSCGGLVARLVSRGEPVTIATACTADAPADQPLSEPAQHEHRQWRLGDRPYRSRRKEDVRACASLGAQAEHLGLLDAVYRRDDGGAALYTRDFLGGQVHPHDWGATSAALRDGLRPHLAKAGPVYSPLAIGSHVDHVVVRRALEDCVPIARLRYYEDFPYAERASDIERLPMVGGLSWGLIELTPDEVDARLRAIACYSSQLPVLFGSADAMTQRVRNYVTRAGGERYWQAAGLATLS
jgi:LmbE family N-acetylglucosaminyl deacetylase